MTVGRVVELFTAMGCEVHHLNGTVTGPDGCHPVRFLYCAETEGFASLSNLDDGDRVPPSQVEAWERGLGVSIPKGNPH